jgi:predicted branched-subunit amino acid permease
MKDTVKHPSVFSAAFKYSFPVLLGYLAIGIAFGLLMTEAGHPWWLSLVMSLVMYAGAGQFIAVGLFAAGAGLWEACLVQLVVNARHVAYGLTMMKRFRGAPWFCRWYLIFGLTDETFALLSSLPSDSTLSGDDAADGDEALPAAPDGVRGSDNKSPIPAGAGRTKFMFLVTLLDQSYWVGGSVIGAVAGTFIPFNTGGIGFALTALFIVLMIEQMRRVRRPGLFVVPALCAVLGVFFLPARISLLGALALSLPAAQFLEKRRA